MEFSSNHKGREDEIVNLFSATFSVSEGPDEGKVIGALVGNLFETTEDNDLFVFLAWQEDELVGSIVFSRLTYAEDERSVFILAPVAVATSWQRKGVGQALLIHGLNVLRELGVDVAITYGDPNYYAKVGFKQITEEVAQAPLVLQQPEGWLAQPLSSDLLTPLKGPSRCVEALQNQIYW
jgi:predicted N-acetyltransferase YhbS